IDPTTGLPATTEAVSFDMSQVLVKFSLPLKHVTLKNVLDAMVKVADQPIEYSVEDYAVVFSPRPEAVSRWRRNTPAPEQPARAEALASPPLAAEEAVVQQPREFNIDFGVWRPELSKQVGPAAAGQPGGFWNAVGVPNDDHHTESGMKFATREPSAIQVEMINLGCG